MPQSSPATRNAAAPQPRRRPPLTSVHLGGAARYSPPANKFIRIPRSYRNAYRRAILTTAAPTAAHLRCTAAPPATRRKRPRQCRPRYQCPSTPATLTGRRPHSRGSPVSADPATSADPSTPPVLTPSVPAPSVPVHPPQQAPLITSLPALSSRPSLLCQRRASLCSRPGTPAAGLLPAESRPPRPAPAAMCPLLGRARLPLAARRSAHEPSAAGKSAGAH